jgi:hypothetical protein
MRGMKCFERGLESGGKGAGARRLSDSISPTLSSSGCSTSYFLFGSSLRCFNASVWVGQKG